MIFVTVGTHEQQFDRLVRAIDSLVETGKITEPVFVQTGYCTYRPAYCEYEEFLSYDQIMSYMDDADVVITHGGPSSFLEAMAAGKVPVVVPRRVKYGEHVNDHQIDFVRVVAERLGGIVPVYDISDLTHAIERAREMSSCNGFRSHNAEFCEQFSRLIEEL